jgi:hypothetical protein
MKNFIDLVSDCCATVPELMPWDLEEKRAANPDLLIVDVREPYEFDAMHIEGSLNVPRGILESACEWDYEETVARTGAGPGARGGAGLPFGIPQPAFRAQHAADGLPAGIQSEDRTARLEGL